MKLLRLIEQACGCSTVRGGGGRKGACSFLLLEAPPTDRLILRRSHCCHEQWESVSDCADGSQCLPLLLPQSRIGAKEGSKLKVFHW